MCKKMYYIKVKKAIEGQDFINTWKIKDINVLTSIEILVSGKKKFTMYIPSSKTDFFLTHSGLKMSKKCKQIILKVRICVGQYPTQLKVTLLLL